LRGVFSATIKKIALKVNKKGVVMINHYYLSECSDMIEERFQECFDRVDMNVFMENPAQALIDAGVILKKGITFKFVETEEEANALA
jgi:hypothetical protein